MQGNNTRYRALLAAVSAAAITSLAGVPVLAADTAKAAPVEELTEVVVTGSILRRTDIETPSPVAVLTAEALDDRGINTVAEAMQRLPANGAGTMTQGWNNGSNFANGANAVSLRGLTVQATLSVFDGLRMAPYPLADDGHRNFVDLNTIPDAVIDRIEVLKDGASSTYGADAIAGVVNVITKREVTGLHFNGSYGLPVSGGGNEARADATWGIGKLNEQGYNFYIAGEYQKTDAIYTNDRSYPFGTNNLSQICDPAGHCLANTTQFGINANGTLAANTTTTIPLVAPANGTTRAGVYQLLNPAAGCNLEPGLTPVTLTAAQAGTTWNPTQCQQDLRAQFQVLQPEQKRTGGFTKFTAKIGSSAEFYAVGSYYDVKSLAPRVALSLSQPTTAPRSVTFSPVILPVYVCGAGVGTFVGAGTTLPNTSTGCNAGNGTLNPNNPFAAAGQNAIMRWRYDRNPTREGDAQSYRGATGITGEFGEGWHYTADLTYSKVKLRQTYLNDTIPQRVADVIAKGTFNFVNPAANSEDIRNYIAPANIVDSTSEMKQAQGTISKDIYTMAGGPLQAAIGAAYRKEAIDNPSSNPDNIAAPFTRYVDINAVGAVGDRNVKSGFFEIDAPFTKQFEANVSGRYDKYSSGQSNFSPKVGLKFKPVEQLALRGTYAKGFRIPSFNESYGLPFAGFSTVAVNCAQFAAYCTAHNNNSYATASYSLGTNTVGNPALKPEQSKSFTLGLVYEPTSNLSFTVDYWNITVDDLVAQVSPAERTAATSQYYLNNGVVNLPGITVTPGSPDPAFPNALPQLGFINSSYNNADSENVNGFDFGISGSFQVADGVKLNSTVDATFFNRYIVTRKDGTIESYAGTLSPCDFTSCSGSPKWRGMWQNTFAWEKLSVTGTVYYTSGYNQAEVDYGGDPNDCNANGSGTGAPRYVGTTIPSMCTASSTWNVDLGGRYKFNDHVTVYLDALNVLGIQAPLETAAAYELTQYNPAWAQPNIVGRMFRLGVKADF
jgi:iron complex outermembrane recepter protein